MIGIKCIVFQEGNVTTRKKQGRRYEEGDNKYWGFKEGSYFNREGRRQVKNYL